MRHEDLKQGVPAVPSSKSTAGTTARAQGEPALLALPGILDARIRVIQAAPLSGRPENARDQGPLRIAYLTGPGAARPIPEPLMTALRLDACVAVGRLGPTGLDDPAVYETLPVWGPDDPPGSLAGNGGNTNGQPCEHIFGHLPATTAGALPKALLCPDTQAGSVARETQTDTTSHIAPNTLGEALSNRPAQAEGLPLPWPAALPRTLAAALEQAAATKRGVRYLSDDGRDAYEPYAALKARALAILAGLKAAGAVPQDRLLIDASDPATFLGAFWACQLGGMVPAPVIVPASTGDPAALQRLRAIWQLLGKPLLVAPPSTAATYGDAVEGLEGARVLDARALEDNPPAPPSPAEDPEATAVIILTSGSTGLPKGVCQTHRAVLSMVAAACVGVLDCSEADVFLNWMPLDHVGGALFLMVVPVALCCEQIHGSTGQILADPLRWVTLVDRYRVTVNWAPNFAFGMIADAVTSVTDKPWDLSCLRALVNGGEAVTEGSLNDFLDDLACCAIPRTAMLPAFGMSETCAPITIAIRPHARGPFASLGGPVPGAALRIVGEDGRLLKEGEIGQLQVRGPQILQGYHDRPDLTEAAIHDGWFDTGDMGFLADGQLYLTGRLKDSIIVNGAKFFAHEIEAATGRESGIDRASVAAVPVRPAGADTDKVAIFFSAPVAKDGAEDDVLRALLVALRSRLARDLGLVTDYLLPVAPDDIPRTGIGKIMRPTLRQRFEAGAYDAVVARVTRLFGGPGTCATRLHAKTWIHQDAPPSPDTGTIAVQAVFSPTPSSGFGGATVVLPADATLWGQAGPWQLAPTDRAGHEDLLTALQARHGRLDTLIHLWGCNDTGTLGDGAYRSLLCLGQAVAALPEDRRPGTILAMTRNAVHVRSGDKVDKDIALIPGLIRALALEMPEIRWRHVDVDADIDGDLGHQAALSEKECAAGAEPETAWRDGRRLVARFAPVVPAESRLPDPPVRPGALWLVTGGLGGIGSAAAARLIGQGARLLLIGRTAPDLLSADKAATLRRLGSLGTVRYHSVDVGDAESLAATVAMVEEDLSAPLAGILHLAGVDEAVPLADDDSAALAAMRRAALDGLDALHGLQAARPGASLTVAASITGRVGGRIPGYAAVGGAALERAAALAAEGAAISTLAFSSWQDVGMSAGRTNAALLQADGLMNLEAETGLTVLEAALWRPGSQWMVGLDDGHPLHAALTLGAPAPLTRLTLWTAGPGADGVERAADLLGRPGWVIVRHVEAIPRRADGSPDFACLAAGDGGNRVPPRNETERRVAMIFGEVLSIEPPAVNEDFFAAGGSSLLAGRLAARLSKRFFVKLPVATVFQNPTVEGLTRALRALETKPGLVDAVAAKLAVIEGLSDAERGVLRQTCPAPAESATP